MEPMQPSPYAPAAPPRTSGKAIAALVLGILGFVVIPLLGIVALVLGYQARGEIERDPGLDGGGMATAGIVLGWILVGIMAFIALIIVVVVAVAFTAAA